jgi:hypothetical protein
MEVSGYIHAFGCFVLAKELLLFIGWEVGGPLSGLGMMAEEKNIAFVLVC